MSLRSLRWALPAVVAAVAVVAAIAVTRPDEAVSGRVAVSSLAPTPARVDGTWPKPKPKPRVEVEPEPKAPVEVEPEPEAPVEVPAVASPTSFLVADAVVPEVALFAAPGVADREGRSLDNPTWEGLPVLFLVVESRPGWHKVRVSTRPNGTVAWIRAADVELRTVANRIVVEVGARRLTVLRGDTPLMSTTVAVGRSGTPTPQGRFFVDGIVRLSPPSRAYGVAQLSISGFSPTLESFGGGIGQIALHGTFAPALLGQAVSNGCVRLDNAAITQVLDLALTGTPVDIVA